MFEIKLIFYGLSSMLQFSQFVWALRYSVWDVFNNFLLIDATDRSKISSDQKRFFIALSLYPPSFFKNTPFNLIIEVGTHWRRREMDAREHLCWILGSRAFDLDINYGYFLNLCNSVISPGYDLYARYRIKIKLICR